MTQTVGIFGLGLIGTALSQRLLAAGHRVLGHDPDAARAQTLTDRGGSAVAPSDVWAAAIVLAAVFDTDQLASLIADAPADADAALVVMSTCDPDRMPELAELAAQKNIRLTEAPLSGTSKDLSDGNAVFLVGGDADQIANLGWLWPVLGRGLHHVGPVGNGNRAKLAVNLVLGLNRAALAEGLVFASSIGLNPAAFLPLLQDTAAASAVMASKGPKMVSRDFAPLGRIAQSAKDFALITASAKAAGHNLPFASTYLEMMERCIQIEAGQLDNAAILLAIELE